MAKRKFLSGIYARWIVRFSLGILGSLLIMLCALFLMVYAGAFGHLASVQELRNIQNYLSSEVYSNDRVLLGKYYFQDRTNIRYQDLPEHLTDALIATEDVRFYKHNGIDRRSTFRVLFKSLLFQNRCSGGGSTIHQQLAKNLYPRKQYSVLTVPVNKFREMILGVRLHKAYSKNEILELYLNTISFGENTYGIETAAHRFFNKLPANLKIEESALLVGMLKGTYNYSPRHYPERSRSRRNRVLSQMFRYGYLDRENLDSLCLLPVELDYVNLTHNEGLAPYFREHLRLVLLEWVKNNLKKDGTQYNIYTDGLKIYTTINADLQRYAEEAVNARMAYLQNLFDHQWKNRDLLGKRNAYILDQLESTQRFRNQKRKDLSGDKIQDAMNIPEKMEIFTWQGMKEVEMSAYDSVAHYAKFLHAGLLSVEAKSGYVRAWVGGINSRYFKYDHVTSRRQAGSTFKPIVYSAALKNGLDPCTYFPNDSVVYPEYHNWTPRNSNRGYGGYYSVKGALAHSMNTISVRILKETGLDKVIGFSKQLGINGELPEVLSLALGTGDVSLKEMVQAYSVFLNDGKVIEPVFLKRIEDKFGNVLYENEAAIPDQVISPHQAHLMTEMLKNAVDRGTASSLRSVYGFDNEIAGKTGTTQNNTDGWFIGYTPVLITGIWVGGDLPGVRFRYGGYGQGASAALPIWARYMHKIYRNPLYRYSKQLSFEIPDSVIKDLACEDYRESVDFVRGNN
ncbi:MAG: transglycosylase domain-containing protein [Bacteroidales bacterium]|nr:transglycosylase domain-containing protein [Bacteroidales bacterium]MBN2699762.1 transglycosylase domain-containing protein [Bacteroidales bacterium]